MGSQVMPSLMEGFLLPLTLQNPSRVASVQVHSAERVGGCVEPSGATVYLLPYAKQSWCLTLWWPAQTPLHGR